MDQGGRGGWMHGCCMDRQGWTDAQTGIQFNNGVANVSLQSTENCDSP